MHICLFVSHTLETHVLFMAVVTDTIGGGGAVKSPNNVSTCQSSRVTVTLVYNSHFLLLAHKTNVGSQDDKCTVTKW